MNSIILGKVLPGDVRRSRDIERVVHVLEDLPEGKAWKVEIEEMKSERTLQQNKYLFGVCYPKMIEVCGYDKNDIHRECCKRHFGIKETPVPKCEDYPTGIRHDPIRTTTTDENGRRSVLGRMKFAEFVECVRRIAAFMGVNIPDPEPSLASYGPEEDEQEEAA